MKHALLAFLLIACSPSQLDRVQDASNKRDVICRFVDVWAQDRPDLAEVDQLCKAGEDLKAIAAAYAGCRVE